MPAVIPNSDGTISIEFGTPEGTPTTVTIRPPKVGGYRRLRKELYAIDGAQERHVSELPEGTSDFDKANAASEFHEGALLTWWRMVLVGDSSFVKLTDDPVPDEDYWPIELATNQAAMFALGHWVSVPLKSILMPAQPTNDPPPQTDPS